MSDAKKIGVVGLGNMGGKHLKSVSIHPEWELVVGCSRSVERRGAAEEEYGIKTVADYKEVTAHGVDAVIIAAPTSLHAEMATFYLASGVDVLLEKPIASTEAEAEAILKAAAASGRVLQVGHIERFNPAWQAGLAWWREHVGGLPERVTANRLGPYGNKEPDTGVTLDLMIHDADLVLGLYGAEPKLIGAQTALVRSQTDDISIVTLEFPGGARAQLATARIAEERVRDVVLQSGDAWLKADLLTRSAWFRQGEGTAKELQVEKADQLQSQLSAFRQAVDGGEVAVTGETAARALAVCLDVVRRGGSA